MLSIAHTLISLPFGIYFTNPIVIFIAAFVFHLFSDTLLHWNIYTYKFKRYPFELVGLDVIGGVALAWLILGDSFFTLPIFVAIAGGNAPDILHGLWDLLPKNVKQKSPRWIHKWFRFHDHLQLETTQIGHGLIWQVLLAGTAIALIQFF